MLGGFKIVPDPKDIFKREEYNEKWFGMIVGVPIVLLMYAFWYGLVIPTRKLSKLFKK